MSRLPLNLQSVILRIGDTELSLKVEFEPKIIGCLFLGLVVCLVGWSFVCLVCRLVVCSFNWLFGLLVVSPVVDIEGYWVGKSDIVQRDQCLVLKLYVVSGK